MKIKIDTKFSKSGLWRVQNSDNPQKNLAVIEKSGTHLGTGKVTYKVRFADGLLVPSPIDGQVIKKGDLVDRTMFHTLDEAKNFAVKVLKEEHKNV